MIDLRITLVGARSLLLVVALNVCAVPGSMADEAADAAYQAKRRLAAELFEGGKPLEALPLLEELVAANPRDDQLLVALAAALVKLAGTLSDRQAAGRERLRARGLLDRAWQLGNTSNIALNLSELLKQLPADGDIQFSDDPRVEKAMRAGEAAFSRGEFDQALESYSKAFDLEPRNYTAALFIGNAYDRQNRLDRAAEWYERAIRLEPNIETAYRYYADMLARIGDMEAARTMLIHAAVAEPYNRIVWRELHAWAALTHVRIAELYVDIPRESSPVFTEEQTADVSPVWQAYRAARVRWRKSDEFTKRYPLEKEYRHSLGEETAALAAAAEVVDQLQQDPQTAASVAADPSLRLLLTLYRNDMIEPYVLFSLGDAGISRDYAAYREEKRDRLEAYLDYLVVPVPRLQ